jgi:micrococcal nuclease
MTLTGYVGRALISSALLVYVIQVFGCEQPDHYDLITTVSRIYDGDTVRLEDGRKLRLIGINTPEMGRKDADPQAGARQATQRLVDILEQSGMKIGIRFGHSRKDRYGRLLGHPFDDNGRNITRMLLADGHGAAVTIAPNDWNADCYYDAEREARIEGRGVWDSAVFGPVSSTALGDLASGFYIIRGKVMSVNDARHSTWLNLESKIGLRIDHDDQKNFRSMDLHALNQHVIEARGWIYRYKGQARMHISSPRAIRIIESTAVSESRD